MSEEDQKKPETTPHRMRGIAWPNAKYGFYLAITIIIVVLLIFYRDLIFCINASHPFSSISFWKIIKDFP